MQPSSCLLRGGLPTPGQHAAPLRRRVAAPFRPAPALRSGPRLIVRAEAGGSGLGDFFRRGKDKEDAARKALEDALKGKKDPFAAAEKRVKKYGGGGDGGGGGGGGGGGFGGFNFNEWGDGFKKWARGLLRTLGAVALFLGALFVMTLWRPMLQLLARLVRIVLRLDGNPRVQMAQQQTAQVDLSKKEGLGNVEESVISKYGAAAVEEEEEEEEDDA